MPTDNWKDKKILITGGAGYLASNLVQMLKDKDCHIVRVGRPGARFPDIRGQARIDDIREDIRDEKVWEYLLEDVGSVFHFAAQTSVYVAGEKPSEDLKINVLPVLHILETCSRRKFSPSILFSGTATECGLTEKLPVDETQRDDPVTIYDLHKLMSEHYLKYYNFKGIVKSATLRLANVYGPGPRSSSADRGVLNMMIRKALRGETLTIFGKGNCLRDYIYVTDVVRAFLAARSQIDKVRGRHFVIGSGEGCTIAQAINLVADRVALITGQRKVQTIHIDPETVQSPIEERNFISNSIRFADATTWRPEISLVQGIDQTIHNYLTLSEEIA